MTTLEIAAAVFIALLIVGAALVGLYAWLRWLARAEDE